MAIGFCILLVVVGSFFLLNVILAVIMDAFDQVDKTSSIKEAKKKQEIRELKKQYGIIDSADESSSISLSVEDVDQEPGNVSSRREPGNVSRRESGNVSRRESGNVSRRESALKIGRGESNRDVA
jgi:hypothetical protein